MASRVPSEDEPEEVVGATVDVEEKVLLDVGVPVRVVKADVVAAIFQGRPCGECERGCRMRCGVFL